MYLHEAIIEARRVGAKEISNGARLLSPYEGGRFSLSYEDLLDSDWQITEIKFNVRYVDCERGEHESFRGLVAEYEQESIRRAIHVRCFKFDDQHVIAFHEGPFKTGDNKHFMLPLLQLEAACKAMLHTSHRNPANYPICITVGCVSIECRELLELIDALKRHDMYKELH